VAKSDEAFFAINGVGDDDAIFEKTKLCFAPKSSTFQRPL
jgi:hypothetical protein